MNGDFVDAEKATVNVLSPAMKYGALVFEGICSYWNEQQQQAYLFRLDEHLLRLQDSMRIMRFDAEYDIAELGEIVRRTVELNGLRGDSHIRLSAWVDGDGTMDRAGPISLMCAAVGRRPRTLDDRKVTAAVSSWRRIDDRSMPPRIKSAANYGNSRLALMQAKADGYDEVIIPGTDGKVSEGAGACLFIVRDGAAATPPVTSGILESVTRASLIELLRNGLDVPFQERVIDRTELYVAQEVFLCGSSYEVTPVTSVDRIRVGGGEPGPVTKKLWDAYEAAVRGTTPDHSEWRRAVFT